MPSTLTTMLLLARLTLLRARRSHQLLLTALVAALPVLGACAALASGNADADLFHTMVDGYLRFLVPFVAAIQATASLADEVQNKTVTYLFCRPIPRWTVPLAKSAAGLVVNLVLLWLSLCLVYGLTLAGEPDQYEVLLPTLARGLLACGLGALLFGAMAGAFGTAVTRYPFVATALFILLTDVAASLVPGKTKVVAMTVHLRVVAGTYTPSTKYFVSDPNIPLAAAVPVLLVVTALWLTATVLWVNRAEYRTDQ